MLSYSRQGNCVAASCPGSELGQLQSALYHARAHKFFTREFCMRFKAHSRHSHILSNTCFFNACLGRPWHQAWSRGRGRGGGKGRFHSGDEKGTNLPSMEALPPTLTMLGYPKLQVLRVLSIPGYTKIRVMVDCCYAAVLVGGIGMLNLHIAVCNSTPANGGFKYDYQIVSRFHIILHVARVAFGIWSALTLRKHVIKLLRVAVSQNKRRFVDPVGGFDLDLAYICDRVIAMAIPTVHRAPYRNDISEVARFFSQKHYGHFRVINLCEEFEENGNGNYAPSYFFGRSDTLLLASTRLCSIAIQVCIRERISECTLAGYVV